MIKDLALAHRMMPDWDKYQRGLEALAASLGPVKSHDGYSKKALTVSDLLVKVGQLPSNLERPGGLTPQHSPSKESADTRSFSQSC